MEKLTLLDFNQFDVYLKSVLFINDRGINADGDFSESKRNKTKNWELLSRKPNIESIAALISVHGTYSQ